MQDLIWFASCVLIISLVALVGLAITRYLCGWKARQQDQSFEGNCEGELIYIEGDNAHCWISIPGHNDLTMMLSAELFERHTLTEPGTKFRFENGVLIYRSPSTYDAPI